MYFFFSGYLFDYSGVWDHFLFNQFTLTCLDQFVSLASAICFITMCYLFNLSSSFSSSLFLKLISFVFWLVQACLNNSKLDCGIPSWLNQTWMYVSMHVLRNSYLLSIIYISYFMTIDINFVGHCCLHN